MAQEPEQNELEQDPRQLAARRKRLIVFAAVLALAALAGLMYWLYARQFEDTDDAQIDGNMSPISARVDGTITTVAVDNNQMVHAGDLLVELDPRDNQVRFDQARAQLAQAQSALAGERQFVPITEVENTTGIATTRADVNSSGAAVSAAEHDRDQARAQVEAQQAGNTRAQNDLERYRQLARKQEISKSEFDLHEATARQQAAGLEAAEAALKAAERGVEIRKAQLEQARVRQSEIEKTAALQLSARQASVERDQAGILGAQAQLEQAQLAVGYTRIVAPVSGVIMKRSAQVGAHVMPGQQLVTIAQTASLWVTANFKETQLLHMRPGQPVTLRVDALGRDLTGTVESIGAATGAVSSVLPPENATGNYVKIVQRIPVRIRLDATQQGFDQLRPGMSVEPSVKVR